MSYATNKFDNIILNARQLAMTYHAGQVDKAGEPYHLHLETTAETVQQFMESILIIDNVEELRQRGSINYIDDLRLVEVATVAIASALLHDILEDTDTSLQHEIIEEILLLDDKLGQRILDIVTILTKTTDLKYGEYIKTISKDIIATIIKRADVMSNSSVDRLSKLDTITAARLTEKYNSPALDPIYAKSIEYQDIIGYANRKFV